MDEVFGAANTRPCAVLSATVSDSVTGRARSSSAFRSCSAVSIVKDHVRYVFDVVEIKFGDVTRWVGIGRYRKEDLHLVKELVNTGKYRPVIDRRYPLDEIVEATRYVESGQKTGNVVLRLSEAAPVPSRA